MDRLRELGKDDRGSRPRCVLLCDGSADQVARRLTDVVRRPEVEISAQDRWQPQGTGDAREVELDKASEGCAVVLPRVMRLQLRKWWLTEGGGRSRTPSWDIASTCTVSGRKGLLLVEAKAHAKELTKGDKCVAGPANRKRIEGALAQANTGLRNATGGSWRLSVEHRYQIANRFAWSWKLAQLGVPVVLLYLGFLNAVEMEDRGSPFGSGDEWRDTLLEYCRGAIDPACWEMMLNVEGTSLLALIRSDAQPFQQA